MRAWIAALCWSVALAPVQAAEAQERAFPSVFVYGERDNDRLLECGVTHRSVVAQVQSTLRVNRVAVQVSRDLVNMYVNVNAAPSDAEFCTYAVELTFGTYANVPLQGMGETITTRVVFCDRGSLLVWRRSTAQEQVNANIATWVNECLSEYQSLPRQ